MTQLESLFVSGKEVDESLLVKILSPFLKIDQDSCCVVPDKRWLKANNEIKITLFLVARKAMKMRGLLIDNEGATPSEIGEETGLKGGSVRPRLRGLFEQKIINRTDDGRYFVPSYSLIKIKTIVDTWLKENEDE